MDNDAIEVCRPYDKIQDVDDSKDVWNLAVRVVDLWAVTSKYRQQSLEMVIADKENGRIHVIVPTEEVAEWKDVLKHDKTYDMENFKVLKNDVTMKACTHPFRLSVTGATIITPVDFPEIPPASFNFKDFGEILAGQYRTDLLIDVVGAFHEITGTNKSGGRTRSVTFLIKDTSANMLHVTLWDEFAKQFLDAINQTNGQDPNFVVVSHARIKPAQGIYPLCVTNCWAGTQVFWNPESAQISDFKARFTALAIEHGYSSQQLSQVSQGSQYSENPDIMSKANFLTLSEVNHVKHETICVTVAEIKKLNANKFGWTYDGCNYCTKSVKMEDGNLKCKNNHINDNPIPRYKVEVQAVHKEDKARFMFWDSDVEAILGISAVDLKAKMIKAGMTNPRAYPKILDKLLCPKKVFKIKALPGSNPFSIIQFSDNKQLLANLEKQFGLEEANSKLEIVVSEAVPFEKELSLANSQSLCGENDTSGTSTTPPPKRVSQEDVDSVDCSQDVQPTQLSSTKGSKQPKVDPKTRIAKQPKLEKDT